MSSLKALHPVTVTHSFCDNGVLKKSLHLPGISLLPDLVDQDEAQLAQDLAEELMADYLSGDSWLGWYVS